MFKPFAAVAILAAASLSAAADPSPDWAQLARADVEAGYTLFVQNHPGWHDPTNPNFRPQLQRARAEGLAAAARAKDANGYAEALGAFSAILSDGHAQLVPETDADEVPHWAGFISTWRGRALYVASGSPGGSVKPGAEILGCDGHSPAELMRRRLSGRAMREREAGRWWSFAPRLFIDSSEAAPPRPDTCRFRSGARTETLKLNWTAAPADKLMRLKKDAADGGYTDIGLTEPRPGLFLIGMPTFQVNDEGAAAYRKLYADLASRHAALASARAVVIDLRFNEGGSSQWSRDAAQVLWGEEAVTTRMSAWFKPVEIWWRASPDNVAYMRDMEDKVRRSGNDATAKEINTLAALMKASLDKGRPFTVEPDDQRGTPAPSPAPTAFATPVYVITPGRCASACLDAIDVFKRFPNTRLIGAPTSADSQYMEVRVAPLPSGKGRAVIPLKIWMNRPRKGGEVYTPDIPMNQFDWSTAAFLDRIEADLGRSARRR